MKRSPGVVTALCMAGCLGAMVFFAAPGAIAAEPCSDPAFRQFDFWLGEWEVRKPDGTLAGINRIERQHGGCVIHEHYTTARGYSGESLNIYDASQQKWHQTWVDNAGLLLVLKGGFTGQSMVLEGETAGEGGRTVRHRITWTPGADRSVRQLWESMDAKGGWTVAFDGRYTKKR